MRALALLGLWLWMAAAPVWAQKLEDQVVRLHVGRREVDRSAPWQYESVRQQSYLAVVVPGGRLLTTAFAVADGTFLEMQRFGSSRKDEVEVVFADYEVNLALLKPAAPEVLQGLVPVELGDELPVDAAVDLYRARDSYQLARMPGSLQEVGVFSAVTSSYSLIAYLLKVQQAGLGWSEPVFQGGRLVALTTGQDQNFVHALPAPIIRHFLEDEPGPRYRGFPAIGVELSSLTSPDMRRLLGADKVDHGVRVAAVTPGVALASQLQVDDVILEVDGTPVSEHGYFAHPRWGKVHLKYLLNQRYGGDTLTLKILRRGEVREVKGPLERFDSNQAPVVAYRYGQPEPHLIFGGLLFLEMSYDYLRQWGKDWREIAPVELLYMIDYENRPEAQQPGRRIIFLSRVLADSVNRGYGDLRHQIVESVNGRPIHSMEDLRQALERPVTVRGRAFAQIRLARDGGEVILAYDQLAAAHERIARTYEVATPASFFAEPPVGRR